MFMLEGHRGEIADNGVKFSPDGRTLVSAGWDKVVHVWDVRAQRETAQLPGHKQFISGLTFIPGSTLIASGSWDNTVRVWDLAAERRPRIFKTGASVISVAASPDGQQLAAVGGDWATAPDSPNGARLWNTRTWKPQPQIGEHHTQIGLVVYSLDGEQLITGAADRMCRIWDVETGNMLASLTCTGWIQGLAVSGDKLAIAAGQQVRLWKLPRASKRPEFLMSLRGFKGTVLTVAFSPDGSLLAAGGKDGHVRIWNLALGKWDRVFRWKIGKIHAVTFAPDGQTMAAGGDGQIIIWDTE